MSQRSLRIYEQLHGRSSKDQCSDRNACKISDEKKNSLGNWTRDFVCCILAKNTSTFCLSPETLNDPEFKDN